MPGHACRTVPLSHQKQKRSGHGSKTAPNLEPNHQSSNNIMWIAEHFTSQAQRSWGFFASSSGAKREHQDTDFAVVQLAHGSNRSASLVTSKTTQHTSRRKPARTDPTVTTRLSSASGPLHRRAFASMEKVRSQAGQQTPTQLEARSGRPARFAGTINRAHDSPRRHRVEGGKYRQKTCGIVALKNGKHQSHPTTVFRCGNKRVDKRVLQHPTVYQKRQK